jgi:electron transfer flavoprotein beta subunit
MKILVPVKRVIDPYAKVRTLPDGSGIDLGGIKFEVNPFDEIAVEQAVRFKESGRATEVIVVSIGGQECEEQLRKALAMGADRAILIESPSPLDSPGVAAELAALARELAPDLVLMGKQGTDDDSNQAGQMLAARLGWPQITFVAKLETEGGAVRAVRETDTGEESVEAPLPAVVTVDLRLNEPRYIPLPGIIKARTKPLDRRPVAVGLAPKTRTLRVDPVPARPPGRRVGSVDELVAELRARGAID